ncbi:MAG: hypothetical protein JO025_24155 [Verrucomicrobia bacterium]|nr:hypothetical protein [Verrucomicrobiota bacterium]
MRRSDFSRGGALLGLMGLGATGLGARAEEKKTAASSQPTGASGDLLPPTFYRTEMVQGIPIFYREAAVRVPGRPVAARLVVVVQMESGSHWLLSGAPSHSGYPC